MIELILIAHVWQKATEGPQRVQKRMNDAPSHIVSKSPSSNPTIQTWLPIFQENFESVTPPALPNGWTAVDGNNDGLTWQTYPAGTCAGSVNLTSKYACYSDDDAGSNSPATIEKLITPQITITPGATSYRVRFNYSFDEYSAAPVETFYVNLVNITQNTTTRILQIQGADSLNKSFTYDISALVSGGDVIQLEFVYDDAGGWEWAVGIDDVVVEGDYNLNNDLAISGISIQLTSGPAYYFYPPGTTLNYAGDVWVKFTNNGSNPLSNFNVYLTVNASNYGPINYSGTLNSNQTDSIQFTNISFNATNNTLKAWHNLSDDFVDNDTLNTSYSPPAYKADTILNYPNSLSAGDAIGSTGNLGNSHQAVRYDSATVWPFVESADSYYITKVFFYHCSPYGCYAGNTRVSLWLDNGSGQPDLNLEIVGKDTTLSASAGLKFVTLPEYIKLEQSILPFYAGRSWNINNQFPFGVDNGSTCIPNYSCWIRSDGIGPEWHQLTEYNLDYSWILGVVVQKKSSKYEEVILPNDARLFKSEFVKNGKLEFTKPIDKDVRIQFYNTNGSIVRDIQVSKGTKTINIGKLPPGTYVYVVENSVGKVIVK